MGGYFPIIHSFIVIRELHAEHAGQLVFHTHLQSELVHPLGFQLADMLINCMFLNLSSSASMAAVRVAVASAALAGLCVAWGIVTGYCPFFWYETYHFTPKYITLNLLFSR